MLHAREISVATTENANRELSVLRYRALRDSSGRGKVRLSSGLEKATIREILRGQGSGGRVRTSGDYRSGDRHCGGRALAAAVAEDCGAAVQPRVECGRRAGNFRYLPRAERQRTVGRIDFRRHADEHASHAAHDQAGSAHAGVSRRSEFSGAVVFSSSCWE